MLEDEKKHSFYTSFTRRAVTPSDLSPAGQTRLHKKEEFPSRSDQEIPLLVIRYLIQLQTIVLHLLLRLL